MKKRLCSAITALALCLGLLPAGAWAAEDGAPAAPTVDAANYRIYANGVPITIEAGAGAGSKIKIDETGEYVKFGSGEHPEEEADLRQYTIYGGAEHAPVSSASITMEGGEVAALYGGGAYGDVNGDTAVAVKDGELTAVFGGGWKSDVTGNTAVAVEGGALGSVLGGGEYGDVNGGATVNVSGGAVQYSVFGGGSSGAVGGQATVTIEGSAVVMKHVFGGGQTDGSSVGEASVTVIGGTVQGSVFGGGQTKAASVGEASVTVSGGTVGSGVYGGGKSGDVNGPASVTVSGGTVQKNVYGGGLEDTSSVETASVTVSGGTVSNDVYGGGTSGAVEGQTVITIEGSALVTNNVFGGGASNGFSVGGALVTVRGGTVKGSVIGGGQASASFMGGASVTVCGGTVVQSVYGGGLTSDVNGPASVTVSGGTVQGDVFGGGTSGAVNGPASVTITGGVVDGGVYGVGLDDTASVETASVTVTGGTIGGLVHGGVKYIYTEGTVGGVKNGLVALPGKVDADSFDNLLYHDPLQPNWNLKGRYTLEDGSALPSGTVLTIEQDTALAIAADVENKLSGLKVNPGGALVVQGKLDVNKLFLNQGAALTVRSGGALTADSLYLVGIKTLTIEKGGSLRANQSPMQSPDTPVAVVNNGMLGFDGYIYGSCTGSGQVGGTCNQALMLDAKPSLFGPGFTWNAENKTLALSEAGLGAVTLPADAIIDLKPGSYNAVSSGINAAGNLTVRGAGAELEARSDASAALRAEGTVTVDGATLYLHGIPLELYCARLERKNGGVVNGLADVGDDCIAYGSSTVSSGLTLRDSGLTVDSGATLTVEKGHSLTISAFLDNRGAIILMDGSALHFEGEVAIKNPGRVVAIGKDTTFPDALRHADGVSLDVEPYPVRISGGAADEDFHFDDGMLSIRSGASLTLSGIPGVGNMGLDVFVIPSESAAPTSLTLDGVTLNALDISAPTVLHLSGENRVKNAFRVYADTTVDGSGSLHTCDIIVFSGTLDFSGGSVTIQALDAVILAWAEGTNAQCPVTFGPGMRLEPDCGFQSAQFREQTVFSLTENGAPLELNGSFPVNAVKTARIYPQSSSGGSGGGSGGSTTTERHPDGSTTTTKTDAATGTVTETTKRPDGSTTVIETRKDGSVTTTETRKDGTKIETATTAAGKTTASVTLPKDKETVTVTIPTPEKPTAGTVAVIVHADGTRETVPASIPGENGLTVTLTASAKLELTDNAMGFGDVPETHWAADAIDFVTARGLFVGDGGGAFRPEAPMSRAMVWTVLARLSGQDTSGGAVWYEQGLRWARETGVSDGSEPDGLLTREQLAAMLYRYAGSPAATGSLDAFTDADAAGSYAADALRWATARGVLSGKGGGVLDPQGRATRAEVAAMLMRHLSLD